jgi:TIR domain-containing protein
VGAVFISYRREDSEGQARALSLELVSLLGPESVFMDVDSIALGRDFRQVLHERLGSCAVMIALIGPGWLNAKDNSGTRRIDSPTDYVRQEIAAALKRDIPVIPVLLQGAQVPPPEQLPDDLKDLSYRNGFELGHSTWDSDVREMVRRLGLSARNTTDSPSSRSGSNNAPVDVSAQPARFSWGRLRIAAVIVLIVGAGGALIYPMIGDRDKRAAEIALSSEGVKEATAIPPAGSSGTTPLPTSAPTTGGGLAASGIEFLWPGNDCWDIFRGTELVNFQCGAKSQALGAGRYTIKGKSAPVFVPFEINVQTGKPIRISQGGVFELAWPGNDCWDIFRGSELVTFQCGAKKQALGAGRYIIKGKSAPVFAPVTVDIKDGSLTRLAMGGVFEFAWPGNDCWDVFRGSEFVTFQCGANRQALGAGRYTIKGKSAPVFDPFDITVADGRTVVKKS